jgi:hypothetical protein
MRLKREVREWETREKRGRHEGEESKTRGEIVRQEE